MTCTCGRPTRNNAYICDNDLDTFARDLGDITWLDNELETTIAKQRALGGDTGAPNAETPLPYNHTAADKADTLLLKLATLVRFCTEERIRSSDPVTALPPRNRIAMSRWLLWRIDGLAHNDLAHQLINDITTAINDCRRAIDLPPERAYAGPCPECKRDLYHRPDATEVRCTGCGQKSDVSEVTAWMRARIDEHMTDRLVTAREGATLLGRLGLSIEQGTIDKWHARKRLEDAGATPKGHRLYRWDDLLTLAARHQRAS